MTERNEQLLKILEAHGREFLGSFHNVPSFPPAEKDKKWSDSEDGEEDEWSGIHTNSEIGSEIETDNEHSTGDFAADNSRVVVFTDPVSTSKLHDPASKSQMKAFMSSKVSKLTGEPLRVSYKKEIDEDEDERSNAQNDALLHQLIHTRLLSGSLNSDIDLTPAQRKKALAGRVLELTGAAKLGKGEKAVVDADRRRAAKRVREGLEDKQREREKQQLEQARHLTILQLVSFSITGNVFRQRT
ncbi:hypothetical protein AX17_000998 [Amanita inopinata Kibby_2008]|nr:hypothetical protein AX17_000998 [Amanita inopinata Kibby_2008]